MSQNPPRVLLRKPCKVRQACDACHARKIRCDGGRPCANCQATATTTSTFDSCTYLAVHKKTGPKGARRARPSLGRPSLSTRSPHVQSPGLQSPDPYPIPQTQIQTTQLFPNTTPSPTTTTPTIQTPRIPTPIDIPTNDFQPSHLVSVGVIRWCLDAFFEYKYPLTPILQRDQVYASFSDHNDDPCLAIPPANYALMAACCAVISLSPEILPPPPSSDLSLPSPDFFIEESLRARRQGSLNLVEPHTLAHIQTSFFLFSAYFCMAKDDAAWFYLRESMTILQTLRLHEEQTYDHLDASTATYARRLFWVLFITERAYALQRHRPLTLQSTLAVPSVPARHASDPDVAVLTGFLDLINLFQHFDADFIASWNSAPSAAQTASTTLPLPDSQLSLARLQDTLQYALPSIPSVDHSEMQQADFFISRQWLKIIVWRLCVSKTLLSGSDTEHSMSLHYPVAVTRDVVLITRLLPPRAFEANGVGILEKIFDMGCSLADLLAVSPNTLRSPSSMVVGPIDTLMEMVRIVGTTLGGSYRHLDVLTDKANTCLLMNVDRGVSLSLREDEHHRDIDEIVTGQVWSLDDDADWEQFLSQ